MSNTKPEKCNSHIHYRYIIFMLVCVSILITCSKWSERSEFTSYLSNAATMTSLFLGVVAIFYSIMSNNETTKNLENISNISTEVKAVKTEIHGFVDVTKDVNLKSAASAEIISSASGMLSTALPSLQQTLQDIADGNSTLKGLIAQLPTKIDLDARIEDIKKYQGEKSLEDQQAKSVAKIPDSIVDVFLERSTLIQNLLVYACVLAYNKKIDIHITKFCQLIGISNRLSLLGFLSCMHATQICTRTQSGTPDKYVQILELHPRIIDNAETYLKEYVSGIQDDNYRALWNGRIENIETILFES